MDINMHKDKVSRLLNELCDNGGVPGDEKSSAENALSVLSRYTENCNIDDFNNVVGYIGEKNDALPTVLLDAHIDRIGMIVTFIGKDGFIKAGKCGGTDLRTLAAQTVTVHGKRKIKGVVSVLPPHVSDGDKKIDPKKSIIIDTGYKYDELEKLVSPGDRITVDSAFAPLMNDRVAAGALDDRAGVAVILYALELMKDKPLRYNVAVSFTVQEEVGGRGAAMIGYRLAPDIVIETDVSFAAYPGCEEETCGKLSGGGMIGFAASLDRAISNELVKLAQDNDIPYQVEVMGGSTGTNADDFGIARGGVRAATVSVPQRNMHMPAEIVDIKDVIYAAALIARFCEKGAE